MKDDRLKCPRCGKAILVLPWCPQVCNCKRDLVTKANGEVATTMSGCLFVDDERAENAENNERF